MNAKPAALKNRPKELILIAYDHIANRGFEGLRVGDVARQAGINNATLHYYFPTKEDLIRGVVDYMIENFVLSFPGTAAGSEPPDPMLEMRAEFEDARRRYHDNRDQLIVYTELLLRTLRDPTMAPIFKKLDEGWSGYLVHLVRRGIQQGKFRSDLDPALCVAMLMLQIKGFGFHMLAETNPAFADQVFDQLFLQVESWLSGKPVL